VTSVTADEGTVGLSCDDQTILEEVIEEDIVEHSISSPGCGVEAFSSSSLSIPLIS